MNLLSVNTRGIGETYKVDWIRRLKSKHGVSFLAIQETQIMEAENIDVRGCWGSDNFGSSRANSTGRSGGLLNVWDRNLFETTELGKGQIVGGITRKKNSIEGIWIVMGDFNAVRRKEERFNSLFCAKTARDFNNFIHGAGLIDMKIGRHRFTCFRKSDLKLSKLDRFLVFPSFLNLAPHAFVTALPREISDHCPILLSTSRKDFGPSPFRFFNSWMLRDRFE